jgi:hypothetical protein
LLVGPAGRGKSAFLLEWLAHLEEAPLDTGRPPDVILLPISLRVGTYVPGVYFQMLACRLAALLEREVPAEHTEPALYYEETCGQLLDELVSRRRKVLIVIDGVDEALGDSFSASWFSGIPGSTVKLVLSARETLGKSGGQFWLNKFGWNVNRDAVVHELPPLGYEAISTLLSPLRVQGRSPAFVNHVAERLWTLTEGEPLLLRLYAEDLLERTTQTDAQVLDLLLGASPGLEGYFDRWLHLQREAWRREGTVVDVERLNAHLVVLACALGSLGAGELGQLVELSHGYSASSDMNDTLWPVRRFVIGDGQSDERGGKGYVLAHPRLRDFFLEKFTTSNRRFVERTRTAFVKWGTAIAEELNAGRISPSEAPRYVISFLGQHLEESGASATDYFRLFDRGWVHACEHVEGSLRGFAHDVRRAAQAAERSAPHVGPRYSLHLRAQLLSNSIRNVALAPPGLLIAALDKQQLGWAQVDARLDLLESYSKARGLSELSLRVPGDHRDRIRDEALAAARIVSSEGHKAMALAVVASRFPAAEAEAIEAESLSATNGIRSLIDWQDAMRQIVPRLRHATFDAFQHVLYQVRDEDDWSLFADLLMYAQEPARSLALDEARLMHRELRADQADERDASSFAGFSGYALSLLYPYLRNGPPGEEWEMLLATARGHPKASMRARAITVLVPFSTPTLRPLLIEEALRQAEAASPTSSKLFYLECLVKILDSAEEPRRSQLFEDAFEICAAESFSDSTLSILAPLLPAPLLSRAFMSLMTTKDKGKAYRTRSLVVLAPYLTASQIADALTSLRANDDGQDAAAALLALAAHLDAEERHSLQDQALLAISVAELPYSTLIKLVPVVHSELNATMAKALLAHWSEDPQSAAFDAAELAAQLPDDVVLDVFQIVRTWNGFDYHLAQPLSLAVLMLRIDAGACRELTEFAFEQTDPWARAALSSSLAARLVGEQRAEAIRVAVDAINNAPEPETVGPATLAAHALTQTAAVTSGDIHSLIIDRVATLARRKSFPCAPHYLAEIAKLISEADRAALRAEREPKISKHPLFRPGELANLLPFIPPSETDRVIGTILGTFAKNTSAEDRFASIVSVIGHLPSEYDEPLIEEFVRGCDQVPRGHFLSALLRLSPLLARLEGAEGVRVVVDGIRNATRCLP